MCLCLVLVGVGYGASAFAKRGVSGHDGMDKGGLVERAAWHSD